MLDICAYIISERDSSLSPHLSLMSVFLMLMLNRFLYLAKKKKIFVTLKVNSNLYHSWNSGSEKVEYDLFSTFLPIFKKTLLNLAWKDLQMGPTSLFRHMGYTDWPTLVHPVLGQVAFSSDSYTEVLASSNSECDCILGIVFQGCI